MTSADDRRPVRGRARPNPRAPLTEGIQDSLDGFDGVGIDSSDDLIDSLISEAGSADEDSIIETGLPDDYDPTGGMGGMELSGMAGKVFPIEGSGNSLPVESGAGSTRVGLLPRFAKTAMPVASKFGGISAQPDPKLNSGTFPLVVQVGREDDHALENEGEDAEEADEEGQAFDDSPVEPAQGVADALPDDGEIAMPEVARPAVDPALDLDLMAELAGGARAVLPVAAVAPTIPAPIPPSAPVIAPQAPGNDSISNRWTKPQPFDGTPILFRHEQPDRASCAWVWPLARNAEAYRHVESALAQDLAEGLATLLPIHGGTNRNRVLGPVLKAALGQTKVSTAHHLHYRQAGRAVFLYVATLPYAFADVGGLLLVEALQQDGSVQPVSLTLFNPALLLG